MPRPTIDPPRTNAQLGPDNTYTIIFRHGSRADYYAATALQMTLEDWQRHIQRVGWDLHDPGLAPQDAQNQLEESIDELIRRNVRLTIIISSPYLRSIETARRIQARLYNANREFVAIVIDRRLGEWPYAAFGVHNQPISPVRNHGHRDITPPTWNSQVLETEMSLNSGLAHAERVHGVLNELAGQYLRPLIVGHLHTITAAHPPDRRLTITNAQFPEGSFIIARLSTDEVPILEIDDRISPPKNNTVQSYPK